ncbi:MAG: hypothetical protein H7X95_14800 [Deltaproteobacteria bacterium]|nr:hypothetical protein [Deltaproteobacteria bacterium]
MGKTQNVSAASSASSAAARKKPDEGLAAADAEQDGNEHLVRDLARVRAKFAMDAPPGVPSLKKAWMSEVGLEEYEAEFVDTVADCLGAGLSLQAALTCWDSGDLAADAPNYREAAASEEGEDEDGQATYVLPVRPRRPTGGHRFLVR